MSEQSQQETPTLLPSEMISEILTRLPAKSVFRFKCVSRTWNSIISNPAFISSYLSHNSPTWHIVARLIEFSTESLDQVTRFVNPPNINTIFINPHKLLTANQVLMPKSSSVIFSSSNGLMLISILIKRDPFKDREKYPPHFIYFGAESALFVGNPITREWVPLPTSLLPVTVASCMGLITRRDSYGRVNKFIVVDSQTVVKNDFILCFLSDTGKWVKKKCDFMIGMDAWDCDGVFEFDNRLVWCDLSVGITIWDEDPFDSIQNSNKKALCRSVSLPSGCWRPLNLPRLRNTRSVHSGGGFIQYLEVFEEGEHVLQVWRLMGFGLPEEGWSLMYNVGRVDFESRGLGESLPYVWFGHPYEVDVAFLEMDDCIFPYNFRTRMVDTSLRFPRRNCFLAVLPSWPTSLPLSLYAVYAKEKGNQYYKDENFAEAIQSYSRSISLSPNALAFANRAMAYIKVGSFREAEEDCTEAINLDKNYFKLYGRRALARKELGNFEGSLEDLDYALKLEPENQEMKNKYDDIKSILEKTSVGEYNHEDPACKVQEEDKQCTD